MSKDDLTDSETEGNSGSSDADERANATDGAVQQVNEYERRRLSRILENKARLEALGLPSMAASFRGVGRKESKTRGKGKGKMAEDEEYVPPKDLDSSNSSSEESEEDNGYDKEFVGGERCGSRSSKMAKNKGSKPKKKISIQTILDKTDFVDDDDALKQAISLSLQDLTDVKSSVSASQRPSAPKIRGFDENKKNLHIQDGADRRKKKKLINSRVQMTEDDLIVHFCQFDENGKGYITPKDLDRVAAAHDFTWTKKEIGDMIHCFTSNGDGKLHLDDFRRIVSRCNMMPRPADAAMD